MSFLDRFLIGGLDQAKSSTARFIEPIGQKPDGILCLDGKIFVMCVRDTRFGCAFNIVAIHVKWHMTS
jgi:hypothetical protein